MRPEETAKYLAALSVELGLLAERAGLGDLAHLYKMAQLEAENIVSAGRTENKIAAAAE